jgi:hypothetical protein
MRTDIMYSTDLKVSESGYMMWNTSYKYIRNYKNANFMRGILSVLHTILKCYRNSTTDLITPL